MRILVACEYSGIVRDAFIRAGHDAMSCDLLPTESLGPHYQGNVLDVLGDGWDMMVAHPPCTYLANSGVSWLHKRPERWAMMEDAAKFFKLLWDAPIPKICIENPVMHGYAKALIGANPTQTVQPHWFGHLETKATCLWLKNLPALTPTDYRKAETMALPAAERQRLHWLGPTKDRAKQRSKTFPGLAEAMAQQWGKQ